MNIYSTPVALYNPALLLRMKFFVVKFARRPSVTQWQL